MKRIVCFVSALFAACALAQAPYPSKPIRLVLPLAVGSATDLIGRVLAKAVSESIGQPIVVDNKAGALGTISATDVARAAPDGYTLLIGTSSALSTAPFMQKNLPYDPVADFTPITDVGRYTLFFYVNADVPAKTLQEFIAYAKSKPGRVTCANGVRHHAIELPAARAVRRHRPAAGPVQERTAVDARHGRRTHRCAVQDAHHRPGACGESRQAARPGDDTAVALRAAARCAADLRRGRAAVRDRVVDGIVRTGEIQRRLSSV